MTKLVLRNDNGASEQDLKAGKEILQRKPGLKKAYDDYVSIATKANSKFWHLLDEFRKPVDGKSGLALNGAEVTAAMLALGANKVRASEMKALCGLGIGEYEFVRANELSKEDALKIARGSVKLVAGPDGRLMLPAPAEEATPAATTGAGATQGAQAEPPKPPQHHKAHADFIASFADLMALEKAPKATDDELPYEFAGETTDGRRYEVRIFVDTKVQS